jgi:erythrocyte band 7 integral membrane protein
VQEYERAAIFRLGRLKQAKAVGPGMFWVNMFTDSYIKVDLRTVSFDIPAQEILTKDSVTIRVDAVCYYRTTNATKSVCEVENAGSSTVSI